MVRPARPGGWVVSVEPDCETGIFYPPHPAFDRLAEIFTIAFSRKGADPLTITPDLIRALRPQILAVALADEQELDELDAAARKHLDNPEVVAVQHLMFLASGRKPTTARTQRGAKQQRRPSRTSWNGGSDATGTQHQGISDRRRPEAAR